MRLCAKRVCLRRSVVDTQSTTSTHNNEKGRVTNSDNLCNELKRKKSKKYCLARVNYIDSGCQSKQNVEWQPKEDSSYRQTNDDRSFVQWWWGWWSMKDKKIETNAAIYMHIYYAKDRLHLHSPRRRVRTSETTERQWTAKRVREIHAMAEFD